VFQLLSMVHHHSLRLSMYLHILYKEKASTVSQSLYLYQAKIDMACGFAWCSAERYVLGFDRWYDIDRVISLNYNHMHVQVAYILKKN